MSGPLPPVAGAAPSPTALAVPRVPVASAAALAAAPPAPLAGALAAIPAPAGAELLLGGRPPIGPIEPPPPDPFKVVLITNRGDPAIRAIREVREFNVKYGTDIKVAVIHSAADSQDEFVGMSDLAIQIPHAALAEAAFRSALLLIMDMDTRPADIAQAKARIKGHLRRHLARDPSFRELYLEVIRSVEERQVDDFDKLAALLRQAIENSRKPITSYMNISEIVRLATEKLRDAGHVREMKEVGIVPGWGFLSERSDFVRAAEDAGMRFVGPTAEQMDLFGHKLNGLRTMQEFGVETGLFSEKITSEDDAVAVARTSFGFPEKPVMVKYSLGGGGRGNKLARTEAELRTIVRHFLAEGKTEIFLEEFIGGEGIDVDHMEFQVVGDGTGEVRVIGWRKCSAQRENQKVFEKTATNVSLATLRKIEESLIRAFSEKKLRGACTAEFLIACQPGGVEKVKFMEVNARLQVEHGITENSYGVNLMEQMLRVAQGSPLSLPLQASIKQTAVSIEARILAENRRFMGQTGVIKKMAFPPGGPGIRIDSAVAQGSEVSAHFDSMIAKLTVTVPMDDYDPTDLAARKRAEEKAYKEAVARLIRALDEFKIVGVETNLPLLREMARQKWFLENQDHLPTVEDYVKRNPVAAQPDIDLAIVAAATKAYLRELKGLRQLFMSPRIADADSRLPTESGMAFSVVVGDRSVPVTISEASPGRVILNMEGRSLPVRFEHVDNYTYRILIGSRSVEVLIDEEKGQFHMEIGRERYSLEVGYGEVKVDRSAVRVPLAGDLYDVRVRAGDVVEQGQCLFVVRSMKKDNEILAHHAGRVTEIKYPGAGRELSQAIPVQLGEVVVRIVPPDEEKIEETAQPIAFGSFPGADLLERLRLAPSDGTGKIVAEILTQGQDYLSAILEDLRSYLLGYDFPPVYIEQLSLIVEGLWRTDSAAFQGVAIDPVSFLKLAADLKTLFGPQFREDFYAMRRGGTDGVSKVRPEFEKALLKALSDYGVRGARPADLDETDLANLLLRMRLAQREVASRNAVVMRLIDVAADLKEREAVGEILHLIRSARTEVDRLLIEKADALLKDVDPEAWSSIHRPPVSPLFETEYTRFREDPFFDIRPDQRRRMLQALKEGRDGDPHAGLPRSVSDFITRLARGRGFTYRRLWSPYSKNYLFEIDAGDKKSLIAVSYHELALRWEEDARAIHGAPDVERLVVDAARTVHMLKALQTECQGEGLIPGRPYTDNEIFILTNDSYPISGADAERLDSSALTEIGSHVEKFCHEADILSSCVVLRARKRGGGSEKTAHRFIALESGLVVRPEAYDSLFERVDRATEKQHLRGLMTVEERFRALFDDSKYEVVEFPDGAIPSGVQVAKGMVNGLPVYAYGGDFRVKAGAFGEAEGLRQITTAFLAYGERIPVIGLMDGAGANIDQGLKSLNWSAEDFLMKVITGGRVDQEQFLRYLIHHPDKTLFWQLIERYGGGSPQTGQVQKDRVFQDLVRRFHFQSFAIADQVGAGVGMVVYGSALLPLQIMVDATQVYRMLTGSRVRAVAMGDDSADYETGGGKVHAFHSGQAQARLQNELASFEMLRTLIGIFHPQTRKPLPAIARTAALVPEPSEDAVTVELRKNLDGSLWWPFMAELRGGETVTTGFGKIAGIPVGVVSVSRETGFGTSRALRKVRSLLRSARALRAPVIKILGREWMDSQRTDDADAAWYRDELTTTVSDARVPQFSIVQDLEGTRALAVHHSSDLKFFVNRPEQPLSADQLALLKKKGYEIVSSIEQAMDRIARVLSYYEKSDDGRPLEIPSEDPVDRDTAQAAATIPAAFEEAYDIRAVISDYLDRGSFTEIWGEQNDPYAGPSLVVGLGRIGGKPHLIIADDPKIKSGAPDAQGADKYRRAVLLAMKRKLPIVVLADAPGFDPSGLQEAANIQGRGAESIETNILSNVPVVTVNLRLGYGGRWIQGFHKFSRPGIYYLVVNGSEIAVMGPPAAEAVKERSLVELRTRDLALFQERMAAAVARRRGDGYGRPEVAVDTDAADALIEKINLRREIAKGLEQAEGVVETAFNRPYNVIGTVLRDTVASMQRLELAGFEVWGEGTVHDGDWITITDGDWSRRVRQEHFRRLFEVYPGATKEEIRAILSGELLLETDEFYEVAAERSQFVSALRAVGVTVEFRPDGAILVGGDQLTEETARTRLGRYFHGAAITTLIGRARRGGIFARPPPPPA